MTILNSQSIEMDITFACNLHCHNCDRSCGLAPSSDFMPLSQIKQFIHESKTERREWKKLKIIGGEPTLHPQFVDVIKLMESFHDLWPSCEIQLWTNGTTKLSDLPDWIGVINSNKTPNTKNVFRPYNNAPIDSPEFQGYDFSVGCKLLDICGMSITRYGYYPCAAGAAVDRVFGYDIGKKNLSDLTEEAAKEQLKKLCRICGHFRHLGKSIEKEPPLITEQQSSETWVKAFETYKQKPPVLTLY